MVDYINLNVFYFAVESVTLTKDANYWPVILKLHEVEFEGQILLYKQFAINEFLLTFLIDVSIYWDIFIKNLMQTIFYWFYRFRGSSLKGWVKV